MMRKKAKKIRKAIKQEEHFEVNPVEDEEGKEEPKESPE